MKRLLIGLLALSSVVGFTKDNQSEIHDQVKKPTKTRKLNKTIKCYEKIISKRIGGQDGVDFVDNELLELTTSNDLRSFISKKLRSCKKFKKQNKRDRSLNDLFYSRSPFTDYYKAIRYDFYRDCYGGLITLRGSVIIGAAVGIGGQYCHDRLGKRWIDLNAKLGFTMGIGGTLTLEWHTDKNWHDLRQDTAIQFTSEIVEVSALILSAGEDWFGIGMGAMSESYDGILNLKIIPLPRDWSKTYSLIGLDLKTLR